MTLRRDEFLVLFLGHFFLLWALHVFLSEYLCWKPKVFFDAEENFETWTEYQMRATRSLFPKGHPSHKKKIRVEKSAAERVLFIATQLLLLCGIVYSFVFETNTWKHVFAGKQDLGKWPAIDVIVVFFFVQYIHELCTRTQYPVQWPAAAHHVFSLVAAAKVIAGGNYFTVAVWYAVCGVTLQIPVTVGIIMFNRYATQFPDLTRTVLRFSYGWYLAVACIGNAIGTLVIVVGYFRHGSYLDGSMALVCIVVWANDDKVYLKWLRRVSEIEYSAGVKDTATNTATNTATGTPQRNISQVQEPHKVEVELDPVSLEV